MVLYKAGRTTCYLDIQSRQQHGNMVLHVIGRVEGMNKAQRIDKLSAQERSHLAQRL